MSEWKLYYGSDEQIAELENAANGWVLKYSIGGQTDVMYGNPIRQIEFSEHTIQPPFTHYLICNPHPLRDMIKRWSDTGQEVWVRYDVHRIDGEFICHQNYVTTTPDWNIPNAEYSFSPFEEK